MLTKSIQRIRRRLIHSIIGPKDLSINKKEKDYVFELNNEQHKIFSVETIFLSSYGKSLRSEELEKDMEIEILEAKQKTDEMLRDGFIEKSYDFSNQAKNNFFRRGYEKGSGSLKVEDMSLLGEWWKPEYQLVLKESLVVSKDIKFATEIGGLVSTNQNPQRANICLFRKSFVDMHLAMVELSVSLRIIEDHFKQLEDKLEGTIFLFGRNLTLEKHLSKSFNTPRSCMKTVLL
eukprot:maker-scaffold_8-snap-gene-1.46-mRNA-1 protein AED:0.00 eAED:0.00 QI:22/1/1/1/0/0/2/979/232